LNPFITCGDQVIGAILLHYKTLGDSGRYSSITDPLLKLIVNGVFQKLLNVLVFVVNIFVAVFILTLFAIYSILYFTIWLIASKLSLLGKILNSKADSFLDKNKLLLSPDSVKSNNSIV